MGTLTNREAAELETGAVLAAAFENHPMSIGWEHDSGGEGYPTKSGHTRGEIQFETIRWLIQEDYLRDEFGFVGGKWIALKLTEKGLNALKQVPADSAVKEPLGTRLVAAVKKEAADMTRRLVAGAIQGQIGQFLS